LYSLYCNHFSENSKLISSVSGKGQLGEMVVSRR